MTFSAGAFILLAQRTQDCKRKAKTEQHYATPANGTSSLISALGICRALAYEQQCCPWPGRWTSRACSVGAIRPFQLAGGVADVHGAGAGNGPCATAQEKMLSMA